MKLWRASFFALALFAALFAGFYFLRSHPGGVRAGILNETAWQRMASPGALSQDHTFLEHNCAACHTSVKGVEASSCIVCHANNTALLQRQPTAFHADIGACADCHVQHQGHVTPTTKMDHVALARIGLRQLKSNPDPETEDRLASANFVRWINQQSGKVTSGQGNTGLTPEETILNCAACHGNKDRHFGLFGQDCAQCHGTVAWTIPEFRHPSPTSQDCAPMSPSSAEPLHDALQNDFNDDRWRGEGRGEPMLPLPSDNGVERHQRRRLLQTSLRMNQA